MSLIYIFDLFGTFVFSAAGAILGIKKNLDLLGIIIVGFVTAVGGGTLRDILLGYHPVFWLTDINYFIAIIAGAVLSFLFSKSIMKIHHVMRIADAFGIGVFTIIGIQKGLQFKLLPVFAIMMGVMTAVAGGVARDVMCQEIPLVLSREIYATACIVGGAVFFLLKYLGVSNSLVIFISVVTIIAIRIVSIKLNLSLPKGK